MRKKCDIPQGYKESPLGIIPEDWEVKRLHEIASYYSGGTPKSGVAEYYDGTIPFIRSGEISKDKTDLFLSEKGLTNSSARLVSKGDLLYALYGANSGQCSLSRIDGAINQAILCIKPEIDSYFLMSVLQYRKNHYYNSFLQGGQGNLSAEIVSNYRIAIPPFEIQQSIIVILQLWDEAIEKQEELIDKLTLRKRGLMQQLLTGKKRIPGFTGEWKQVKLGEVCTFFRNVTLSRGQLNDLDGQIQNVHYGDVLIKYSSILDCVDVSLPYINKDVVINSNADLVQNGDIIMSDTAEDETVGKACEVINVGDRKILAGLHTMLIRPKSGIFAPSFMGYYINSEVYQKQLLPLIQGIKVCSLGKQAVQNTIISVPSRKEQEKIVEILTLCDSEIRSAVKKKAEMQSQKRGLMQQLLTGKKRL